MATFTSYDSLVRWEDVQEDIANVDIRETPFVSTVGVGEAADNTETKWEIDVLDDSGDNASNEGSDPTYPTLVDPTKPVNITQILRKPFKISVTKENIVHQGFDSSWEYQKAKKTIALKKDLEHAALFGTIASGTGSADRRMRGLISFITTYKDGSSHSGKLLSASIFSDLAQNIWTNSNLVGGNVLVGAFQKKRISETFASFNGANTREIVDPRGQVLRIPVESIDSDFGEYQIQLSHEMNTNAAGKIVAYRPDFHNVAYLRGSEPQAVEYARTGLARKGEVWLEGTLRVKNEKTNGVVENLATS